MTRVTANGWHASISVMRARFDENVQLLYSYRIEVYVESCPSRHIRHSQCSKFYISWPIMWFYTTLDLGCQQQRTEPMFLNGLGLPFLEEFIYLGLPEHGRETGLSRRSYQSLEGEAESTISANAASSNVQLAIAIYTR